MRITINTVPSPAPAAAEAKRCGKDLSMPRKPWMVQVSIWEMQLCRSRAGGCKGGLWPHCPSSKCGTAQHPKQRMLRKTPGYFFLKYCFSMTLTQIRKGCYLRNIWGLMSPHLPRVDSKGRVVQLHFGSG